MDSTGYIEVWAFVSNAQIPLQDAAIAVTAEDGTAIALRLTDLNGRIRPISVPVPDLSAGQTSDTGVIPYRTVNLFAGLQDYERVECRGLQIFPGVTTRLKLEMIPVSEVPDQWDRRQVYNTPAQNL